MEVNPPTGIHEGDLASLQRTLAEVSFLASLGRATSSALDEGDLFDLIIRETCRVLDVPVCSLYVVEGGDLVLSATNGLNPAGVGVARMPIGIGITGQAASLRAMIPLRDAAADPRFHWIDGVDQERFTAMCSVPLVRAQDHVVGVLNVQRQDVHEWTDDECATLTAIASQLAGVIERNRLQRLLEQQLAAEREATRRWRQLTQARSDLLSMVSHDVRTPLAIASTYVDALDERLVGEEQKVLEQVKDELDHVTRMVETILSALAVEAGAVPLSRRDVDLVPFLIAASSSAGTVARGRRIALRTGPTSLVVPVDEERLRQVVHNLLLNAVQHSPEGAPVDVSLDAEPGGAVIAVIDRGPGVPEDARDAVFERFRSGARRGGGTGIGLFVVRTIVEAHGGSVGVDDAPGGGARFWVRLPLEEIR